MAVSRSGMGEFEGAREKGGNALAPSGALAGNPYLGGIADFVKRAFERQCSQERLYGALVFNKLQYPCDA